MWEHHYQTEICSFLGHTARINKLLMSPNKKSFLSVSEDGTVKLWLLPNSHSRNSFGSLYEEQSIPSPFLKQHDYHNFFPEEEDLSCRITFRSTHSNDKLISAAFCNRYDHIKLVVTGSEAGEVVVWNVDTEQVVRKIPQRGYPAKCVAFSADDTIVIFSCNKNILLYGLQTGEYLSQFCNGSNLVSMIFVVPNESKNELVSISGPVLSLWKWKRDENVRVVEVLEHKELNEYDYDGKSFTCGAVTKDGRYLVTGSTDLFLRTYDLTLNNAQNIIVEKYNEKGVVCLDTFFKDCDESQVHILLVGSENKTVKQWYVHSDVKESSVKTLPIFDAFWATNYSIPRIAAANTDRQIQILNGYKILMETEQMNDRIACVCFSICGEKIHFALENGNVYEYDYKTRKQTHIMSLNGHANFLKSLENLDSEKQRPDSSTLLIAGSKNGNLMLYKNKQPINLKRNGIHSNIKPLPLIPIVQCYMLKRKSQKILSVAQNRVVSLWDLDGTNKVLIGDKTNANVAQSCLSTDERRLVVAMSEGCFEIYDLVETDAGIELELVQTKKVDGKLSACSVSYDGNVVAVGREDGRILVSSKKCVVQVFTK